MEGMKRVGWGGNESNDSIVTWFKDSCEMFWARKAIRLISEKSKSCPLSLMLLRNSLARLRVKMLVGELREERASRQQKRERIPSTHTLTDSQVA